VFILYSIHARPVRDLRNNYAELAKMTKNSQHIIVTNNGKDETVLMSIDDYNICREILHTRYVLAELEKAEKEAADPSTKWLTHDDVFTKFREKYNYGV
jgi:prevent-host-death family protein